MTFHTVVNPEKLIAAAVARHIVTVYHARVFASMAKDLNMYTS